ncbi:MAG: transporter [Nitrospira sp.]|nr:transporter [Nitrospira sp.]MDH4242982.1 transporter [Nitrospira sp.]MDH4354395.1 transporter [Nitrospira sp.]MDH5317188.1 transporter [Nitrospira sp.]
MLRTIWTSVLPIAAVIGIVVPTISPTQVDASCGSVSCFVVIGSQQQVPMKGLLTVNAIYNWTPMEAPSGEGGRIPFANQGAKTLTLANLNVNRIETTTRTATLDLNYGLTERLGIQVAFPYKHVESDAQIGGLNPVPYSEGGLGDIRATLKYNLLPTLRSMVVLGVGVDFPTGDYGRLANPNTLAESTLQIGRGNFGVVPMIYQTYELIPHRLNQFALASYRYTAKNSDGYKFGDEVNVSLGLNIIPLEKTPWLVLMQQFNFRWMQNDAMDAALFQFNPTTGSSILLDPAIKFRSVPTTGSTYLAYSPGIMVNVFNFASAYFIAQIPIHRDFNGNLEQQISYIFGVTKSFQLFGGSS